MADKLQIRVDGMRDLKKRFKTLTETGQKRVAMAINENAVEFQRKVRKSIRTQTGRHRARWEWGGGRAGRKNGVRRGKKIWSSTPGRPPNSNTGDLVKSIKVTTKAGVGRGFALVRAGGPGAKYAKALEKSQNRNMRRPYMGPMFKKLYPVFVGRIRKAIMGAI